MSLIQCKECNAEVSDTALSCPKCGKQLRKPSRSLFGKLIKWLFILFNLFMFYSLVKGMGAVSELENSTAAHVGGGIGLMMILSLWVMGDIILGLFVLFTRPKP
jgi:hypothetical protein